MRFLLTFFLVSIATGLAVAAPLALTLKPEAHVSGANVTVGDVVSVDGTLSPTLLQLPLGTAPDLNGQRSFSRDLVAGVVAAHPEFGKVEVTGSQACLVTRPARIVTSENLSGVILGELEKAVGNQGQVKIEEFTPMPPVTLPAGQISAQAQLSPSTLLHPWASASINFYVGGELVGTSEVRFRWSWQRQAYQAVRNIQVGEVYNPIDFRLTTVDAIRNGGNYMTELPASDNQIMARQLSTGMLLLPSYLAPKRMIERGDHVTVNYIQPSFKVSMKGVALQDGIKGQTISVQNSASQKSLFAKVVDTDTLEVIQ